MTSGPIPIAEQSHKLRTVFEFLIVAICTLSFVFGCAGILASLASRGGAGSRDFVEYWAAGQQMVHHANPYDGIAIRKLEIAAGFPSAAPTLYLGNPPSALLLVLPLGWISPTSPATGEFLWELLLLLSLILSIQIMRGMLGPHPSRVYVLAFAFAPVLTCILAGQIALFLLLGLVLFLRLHKNFPFLAGAALWFCLLKPHLFLPFGIVLIVWIIQTQRYRIIAGTAAALILSSSIATILVPQIWTHYRDMMREQRIDQLDLPSLSVFWRQHVYPHTFWMQCMPAAVASVWAIAYFRKHRESWSWLKHGSLLTLVSVLVAPYSWFMDQTILIPALLYGLYAARSRTLVAILALMSALLEIAAMRGTGLYSYLYFCTTPFWLAWFLLATRSRATSSLPGPQALRSVTKAEAQSLITL